jgi:Primase X
MLWLGDQQIKESEVQERKKCYSKCSSCGQNIQWIEQLLQKGIADWRKFTIWRILAPYLINIRKLSYEDAFDIIRKWLEKCNKLELIAVRKI